MDYLPINVQLSGRNCLIVGGGDVAARKLKHLLQAKGRVSLLSYEFNDEIRALAQSHPISLIEGAFSATSLHNIDLVIVATEDVAMSRQVSLAARKNNIWVNVVDNLELSTFIMPAIIDRSPLVISISSSGISPVLARKIREKIECLLPKSLGKLLNKLKTIRPDMQTKLLSMKERRSFAEWFIEKAFKISDSSQHFQWKKGAEQLISDFRLSHKAEGSVSFIGAGLGNADMLSVMGLKILQKADVVLYDTLVGKEILECVRKDATFVHIGQPTTPYFVTQDKTSQFMIDYARQGLSVIRLKQGFLAGRQITELPILHKNKISYEIVPEITAPRIPVPETTAPERSVPEMRANSITDSDPRNSVAQYRVPETDPIFVQAAVNRN